VKIDMPILVRKPSQKPSETFVYEPTAPTVTAKSYLAVDTENDTILAADNISTELPIASVVK
jgi:D-alanyl-D-alanine carboxypeptidase